MLSVRSPSLFSSRKLMCCDGHSNIPNPQHAVIITHPPNHSRVPQTNTRAPSVTLPRFRFFFFFKNIYFRNSPIDVIRLIAPLSRHFQNDVILFYFYCSQSSHFAPFSLYHSCVPPSIVALWNSSFQLHHRFDIPNRTMLPVRSPCPTPFHSL